jgi:hypothetical protein
MSPTALIKRGCDRRDLRLSVWRGPRQRNDHFSGRRYSLGRLRPPARRVPASLAGRAPPPPARARPPSPAVRTPHNSAPSGHPRRRNPARDHQLPRVPGDGGLRQRDLAGGGLRRHDHARCGLRQRGPAGTGLRRPDPASGGPRDPARGRPRRGDVRCGRVRRRLPAALSGSLDPGRAEPASRPRARSRSDPKNLLQNCQQITRRRRSRFLEPPPPPPPQPLEPRRDLLYRAAPFARPARPGSQPQNCPAAAPALPAVAPVLLAVAQNCPPQPQSRPAAASAARHNLSRHMAQPSPTHPWPSARGAAGPPDAVRASRQAPHSPRATPTSHRVGP